VFVRGECDLARGITMGEPIAILFFLFGGGAEPACLDACDVNDDESLDVTDVLYLLHFLFLEGEAPAPPFPLENPDPDGAALTCANGRDPPDELLVSPPEVVFYRFGASTVLNVLGRGGPVFPFEEEHLDPDKFQDLRTAHPTSYLSSAPQVCEVSDDGVLTARSLGGALIEVRHRGLVRQVGVSVVAADDGRPRVRITSPLDSSVVSSSRIAVEGRVDDPTAEVRLAEDLLPIVDGAFRGLQDLELGRNRITIVATNDIGEETVERLVYRVLPGDPDAVGPDGKPLPLVPTPQSSTPDTAAPHVEITSPAAGTTLYGGHVVVRGNVDDSSAEVRVGGVPAWPVAGAFEMELQLEAGTTVIVAEAIDAVGNRSEVQVEVRVDDTVPRLAIDGIRSGSLVSGPDVRIEGTVDPAGTPVFVNGRAAHVAGGRWRSALGLEPGVHAVVVRAELAGPEPRRATRVCSVVVDDRAPELRLAHPSPAQLEASTGHRHEGDTWIVAGQVEETFGVPHELGGLVRVSVGGVEAEIPAGAFRLEVPVESGLNTLDLVVEDARGNRRSHSYLVQRDGPPAPTLAILAGDRQVARIGEPFNTVLAVRANSSTLAPVADVPVRFEIVQGDAVFSSGAQSEVFQTATTGSASVNVVAGRQAGENSVVVRVSADGYANSPVAFVLGVEPGLPQMLVAHRSRHAVGEAFGSLAQPFEARLLDAAGNPVRGESVTFRVVGGEALFPSGGTQVAVTDEFGIAAMPVDLPAGDSQSTIEARCHGIDPVTFFVSGYTRGAVADTRLRVEVVDERGQAIVGARVVLPWLVAGTDQVVGRTDHFGEAVLAPATHGEVLVQVTAAPKNGAEFGDVTTRAQLLAGRDNELPRPIVLPRLDGLRARTQFIGPGQGGVLTLPVVSGLRLDVAPGSVRFPDGAESGDLTLVVPHRGGLPAAPPDDGYAEVPVWLLPAGVRFDPPAVLRVPLGLTSRNVGTTAGPSGRRLPFFVYRAGNGGFVESGGGGNGAVQGVVTAEADGSIASGGLYFFGDRGPPGGRTANVRGTIEGVLPGVGETPQREASVTLGFQVYAHSGELFVDETDLELRGRGLAYRFRRRYESRHSFRGALGYNWEHEYADRRLYPGLVEGNVVRATGRGRFDEFLGDGGRWVSAPGVFSVLLVDDDGRWVERTPEGVRYTYQAFDGTPLAGRLLSIADSHGNRLVMTLRGDGRIDFVTDPLGRRVTYAYDAEGRIHEITGPSGRKVGFLHDERGDLVGVVRPAVVGTPNGNDFPEGTRQTYVYAVAEGERELEHNLVQIIDPREAASEQRPRVTIEYGKERATASFDRVTSQLVGGTNSSGVPAGGDFVIEYETWGDKERPTSDAAALEAYLIGTAGRTTLVDPSRRRRLVTYNGAGLCVRDRLETLDDGRPRDLTRLHPPSGVLPLHYETRRRWSREGLLLEETQPRGNRTLYTYDVLAPLRISQGSLVRVERHGSDGVGEPLITEYQRDPLFGHVVSEMPPRAFDAADGEGERFRRRAVFDYQEGTPPEALARSVGVETGLLAQALTRAGVLLNLGDRNGDDVIDRSAGDVVLELRSRTSLGSTGSTEETRLLRTRRIYNRFGQETRRTDEDGRVEERKYHPESDPEGDGESSVADGLDSVTGGFLASRRLSFSSDSGPPESELTRWRYDRFGGVSERIDPLGHRIFETHDARGRLVERRVAAPLNYRWQFFYDADGNLVQQRTQNYTSVPGGGSFLVSANPWIEEFTEYDLLGRRVSLTQELSNGEVGPEETIVTRYRYHPTGELARVLHPSEGGGEAEEDAFFYDSRGLRVRRVLGVGSGAEAIFTTAYDENGSVVLETDAADSDGDGVPEVTERRYDGYGRLAARIDSAGGVRIFERDADGQVVEESFLGSEGGASPTAAQVLLERFSYRYDELGDLSEKSHEWFGTGEPPRTLSTRWGRDAVGRIIREVAPDGSERFFEYDASGRLSRESGPHGNDRRLERDVVGNVLREIRTRATFDVIDPSLSGDVDYDPAGHFLEVASILRLYDPLGRLTVLIDPAGGVWRMRYDSRHNRVFVSDATGTRINPQTDPELAPLLDLMTPLQLANLNDHGNRRLYEYDGLGRLVAAHHELRRGGRGGGEVEFTEPFVVDGVIDEEFEWDRRGRLRAWVDDAGGRTTLRYDAAGYVTTKTWPDLAEESYERNRDGQLTQLTDPNGSVIHQRLDTCGRVVERTVEPAPGIEGTTLQRFEYDGLSRMTLAFDGNDPLDLEDDTFVERRYDSLGNMVEEVEGQFAVRRRNDSAGRLLTLFYPGGQALEHGRDPAGHLTSLADGAGALASYRRFGSGLVLEKRLWNGPVLSFLREDQDGILRNSGYGVSGDVREQIYRTGIAGLGVADIGQGDVLFGFSYGRQQSGLAGFEIPAHGDGAGNVWRFDSIYRLREYLPDVFDPRVPPIDPLKSSLFFPDGNHSWGLVEQDFVESSFESNSRSQYTNAGGESLEYDAAGNLTRSGERRFVYDALRRLVRVNDEGALVGTYAYDAAGAQNPDLFRGTGRLASKDVVSPVRGQPAGPLRYIHCGERVIEERAMNSDLARQYFYEDGGRVAAILAYDGEDSPSLVSFLHDDRGAVVATYDENSLLQEMPQYDPRGNFRLVGRAGTVGRSSRYGNGVYLPGTYYDFELGLYRRGARFFDPALGRFLTEVASPAPTGPLELNPYLGDPLPVVRGEVTGSGSAVRRAEYLEPFCIRLHSEPHLATPADRALGADGHRRVVP
jgi:YD repeat-containing protein